MKSFIIAGCLTLSMFSNQAFSNEGDEIFNIEVGNVGGFESEEGIDYTIIQGKDSDGLRKYKFEYNSTCGYALEQKFENAFYKLLITINYTKSEITGCYLER